MKDSTRDTGVVSTEAAVLPGPELISEWFIEDKTAAAERVRFEKTDTFSAYVVSGSKGAL